MERDEALAALREVAVEVLSVEPDAVTEEARFKEDLDADSLDLVELVMGLEERFDISVPEEDLEGVDHRRPGGRPGAREGRTPRHEPTLDHSITAGGRGSRSPASASRRRPGRDLDTFWATLLRRRVDGGADPALRPVRPPGARSRARSATSTRPRTSGRRRRAGSTASRSSASPPPPTRSPTPGELGADPSRCAVIVGTGVGGLSTLEENERDLPREGRRAGSARSSCR